MNDETPKQNQPMPLVLTGQQRTILEALQGKETEQYPLSKWYLGALYALENPYNPDCVSQAAQSLRELLEKLPRVVRESDAQGKTFNFAGMRRDINARILEDKERYPGGWKGNVIDAKLDKTLKQVDRYLALNQQPTRKKQIQKAVATIDPMVDQLNSEIRQAKLDELYKLGRTLEDFAHHREEPDIEEFRQSLETLERIIFDLLAPITAQDQHEIQAILKRSDRSESDVERMLLLIGRRGANFAFFFNEATDSTWIPVLKEKGYFAQPPNVEPIDDGRVNFPFWWPVLYLARVSMTDPCLVVDTILDFQDTDNPRILHEVSKIALEMEPIEQSLRLKDWVLKYVRSSYPLSDPDLIAKLMIRWAGASTDATDAALELMRAAVSFKADPESRVKQARSKADPEDWIALTKTTDFQEYKRARQKLDQESRALDPQPRFGEWAYQEILERGVRTLSEREPYQTARGLTDAAANLIHLSFHQDELEEVGSKDNLTGLCKRVNESSRHYQDPREALVLALTVACEKVYEKAPESVSALDQALRNQHWDIFTRIRQHLYALHPTDQTKPWIREMILTHEHYGKWQHHFEFQYMIRLACETFGAALLTKAEREQIFQTILSGPSKQDFREFMGDQFTEESFEKRKHYFHRAQLSPFAPVLYGKYFNYFQELQAQDEKPVSDDDYPPYRMEGVRSGEERSPKPADELKKISDEEILSFLNEWQDVHFNSEEWWVDINFRGLAQAFESIFKEVILPDESRLHFWIDNRDRIQRPIYVRAMVSVVHEQVKSGQFDKLDQWFELCEWVLTHPDQPREEGSNPSDESQKNPDWESSRRAVGDFIEMCLEKDTNVPLSARSHLASLLNNLCTQYDRRLDDAEPVLVGQDDQLSEAINKTRSRALKSLIDFGYWVRRQLEDNEAETPEVFAILEKRIGSGCERQLTLPEYALLGMHYIRIWGLNKEWAAEHKRDFFPQENLRAWVQAFGNFLQYNRPYRPTFELVRDDIEFALEDIKKFRIDRHETINLTDTLGEHLFTYYLWGVYPLSGDGSLLERFYEKTEHDRSRWSHLFDFVGRVMAESGRQLEEGLKQRSIEFFDWRFEKREPSELKKFTYWLEAKCLDAEWRLKSYSRILDISGPENIEIYSQMSTLPEMLEDNTALVVECFAKLTDSVVKNRSTFYIQPDKAKPILRAGLHSDDATVRANAKQARENLLKDGRFDFLDEEQ